MNRRAFLTALAAGVPTVFAQREPRRPNVVLILADDLGWGDLESYGAPDIRTPHIDSMAARESVSHSSTTTVRNAVRPAAR